MSESKLAVLYCLTVGYYVSALDLFTFAYKRPLMYKSRLIRTPELD